MSKFLKLLVIALKGIIFLYIPVILLLYFVYEVIFKINLIFSWEIVLIMGLSLMTSTASSYAQGTIEQEVEDFETLKNSITKARWEVIEEKENSLTLKPRFSFPSNLLTDTTVQVNYFDKNVTLEGPWTFINKLKKDVKGRELIWLNTLARIIGFVLLIFLAATPILDEVGFFRKISDLRHESFVKNVEEIQVKNEAVLGNTVGNTNNHGVVVENDEYIFYVEDYLNLVRVNKDFEDKQYLIENTSGYDINSLNIVGNYIYYVNGDNLNRITFDGTGQETIYKSKYLTNVNIKNQWIYFIKYNDDINVYRMDINGRGLETFLKGPANDISVDDDRVIFSHIDYDRSYVESVKLDGTDRRVEFEDYSSDLIKTDEFYYYIANNYNLYRRALTKNSTPEIVIDDLVSSYIIIDESIYYSLHSRDVGYPGTDLYKIGLDGSEKIRLTKTEDVGSFGQAGKWLLFSSTDNDSEADLKRLDPLTDVIESVK